MNKITPIAFDKNKDPWFSVYDICTAIGIKKPGHNKTLSAAELNDNKRAQVKINTKGGIQKVNAVNESGMMIIISRSRKPAARKLMGTLIRDLRLIRDKHMIDSQITITSKGIMKSLFNDNRYIEEEKEYIKHSEKYQSWRRE